MAQNKESKVVVNCFIPMIGGAFHWILILYLVFLYSNNVIPGAMLSTFLVLEPVAIGILLVFYSYSGSRIELFYQIVFPWSSVVTLLPFFCAAILSSRANGLYLLEVYLILTSIGGLIGGAIANRNLGTKKI